MALRGGPCSLAPRPARELAFDRSILFDSTTVVDSPKDAGTDSQREAHRRDRDIASEVVSRSQNNRLTSADNLFAPWAAAKLEQSP